MSASLPPADTQVSWRRRPCSKCGPWRRFTPGAVGEGNGTLLGIQALDAAGFTAVVATNLEQDYVRYLRLGDLVTQKVFLEEVSDEKRTALGTGHFLNYRYEFSDQQGEPYRTNAFSGSSSSDPAQAAGVPAVPVTNLRKAQPTRGRQSRATPSSSGRG